MAVNKVVYGQNTLMDLTPTTAKEEDVAAGKIFFLANGEQALGSAAGGSSYKLLASQEYTVNTTQTSNQQVGYITLPVDEAWTTAKIIYIRVRDKAGKRLGYFYGSDAFFINTNAANGGTAAFTSGGRIAHRYSTSGQWGVYSTGQTTGYGVFGYSINSAGRVYIYRRYNSNYSLTINGTYVVEVYALDFPDGVSPFDA